MELPRLIALSVFCSYFALIIGLFCIICASLHHSKILKISNGTILFSSLTALSFVHTWFYMFRFMEWSFRNYEASGIVREEKYLDRLTSWLLHTELFEQAWASVSFGPVNWWWSEQLCLFTAGAWTIFLFVKGRHYNIRYVWAYMLLGQVVAISVASNLFCLALILSQNASQANKRRSSPSVVPAKLWASVLLSLITVGVSPFTTDRTFLPNLLIMHALLVVPLVSFGRQSDRDDGELSLSLRTLYGLVALFALVLRVRTSTAAVLSLPSANALGLIRSAWEILHSHPAQSSIGWDVIWTTLSFCFWAAFSSRGTTRSRAMVVAPIMAVATAIGSIGATAPYYFHLTTDAMVGAKEE